MGQIVFVQVGKLCPVSYTHLDVYKRQELDYLIYNDPLGYANLILDSEPEEYLKNAAGSHGLEI